MILNVYLCAIVNKKVLKTSTSETDTQITDLLLSEALFVSSWLFAFGAGHLVLVVYFNQFIHM